MMEEQKKVYRMAFRNCLKENTSHFAPPEHRGLFYKAFFSGDRVRGKCMLAVVWKSLTDQKYQIHRYELDFTLTGLKKHSIEDFPGSSGRELKNRIFQNSIEISLLEAAAILQDACETGRGYRRLFPQDLSASAALLDYDTGQVGRSALLQKLTTVPLDSQQVVYAYAAAMRREDAFLMYDLSSPQRQLILGPRNRSLFKRKAIRGAALVLKSRARPLDQRSRNIFLLETFFSTPEEQIQKSTFVLKTVAINGSSHIDSVKEIERINIANDHPQNPLNYRVLCTVFQIRDNKGILNWLQTHPHLFLAGEFAYGKSYKWIVDADNTYTDFNIADCILGEVIITDSRIIAFSPQPENLLMLERQLVPIVRKQITGFKRCSLPLAALYKTMVNCRE